MWLLLCRCKLGCHHVFWTGYQDHERLSLIFLWLLRSVHIWLFMAGHSGCTPQVAVTKQSFLQWQTVHPECCSHTSILAFLTCCEVLRLQVRGRRGQWKKPRHFGDPGLLSVGKWGLGFGPIPSNYIAIETFPLVWEVCAGGHPGAAGHGLIGAAVPAEGCQLDTRLLPAKHLVLFLGAYQVFCGCPGGKEWFGGGTNPICTSCPSRRWRCLPQDSPLHQLLISAEKGQHFLAPSVSVLGEIDWAAKIVSETLWGRGIAGLWFERESFAHSNWEAEAWNGLEAGRWDAMNREGAALRNAGLSPGFTELHPSADLLRSSHCCLLWLGVRP